jgi:hypothetical protein
LRICLTQQTIPTCRNVHICIYVHTHTQTHMYVYIYMCVGIHNMCVYIYAYICIIFLWTKHCHELSMFYTQSGSFIVGILFLLHHFILRLGQTCNLWLVDNRSQGTACRPGREDYILLQFWIFSHSSDWMEL